MRKLAVVLMTLGLADCKHMVRQTHNFQPTVAIEASGRQVAKQVVLLTNSTNSEIEKRIKSDPRLEEKLNEILITKARRRTIIDTLRNVLSWPSKLILWQHKDATDNLPSDDATELELALAEDGSIPTDIDVEKHDPRILWQRTFDNNRSSTLAKLNFGQLNALIYTVIPDESLYTADKDNLFTDTVVIYADDLDATLREVNQAINTTDKLEQEVRSGWYTLGRLLSPVRLYREAVQMGKAFIFNQDQDASYDDKRSLSLTFTAFGAYLATAVFVGDEIVSMAKVSTGRDITRLSKWIHDRAAKVSEWKVFSKAKNVDRGAQHTSRLGRRAIRLGLAIPVVVAAHIVGRVIEAKIDSREVLGIP